MMHGVHFGESRYAMQQEAMQQVFQQCPGRKACQ
jgi:hypothetical protein